MRPRSLLAPTIVAVATCSTLSACGTIAQFGGIEIDIPNKWESETDGVQTLAARAERGEWTFVMLSVAKDEVDEGKSLDVIGQEVVAQVAARDDDGVELSFGEPEGWSGRDGLGGIQIGGTMSDATRTVQIRLLIVPVRDRYLVAFGYRGPNADAKDDKAVDKMLASIRGMG